MLVGAALATSAARLSSAPPVSAPPVSAPPANALPTLSAPPESASSTSPQGDPTVSAPTTPANPTPVNPRVEVPDAGSGAFVIAPTTQPPPAVPEELPKGAARETWHYTVEVEGGLPFVPEDVADFVDDVLSDERGWSGVSPQRFVRVTDDQDLRVLLASPATTDRLCAPLRTNGEVSCRNGDRVVLNALRWARGVPDYAGDLTGYRTYLVNHEVGHALGEPHRSCSRAGAPAPTMQQQTYGLDGCRANGWPTVG